MAHDPFKMRKLTLLGAKHLLKGGHISKTTHTKMVKAAKAMKPPKMEPVAPEMPADVADAPLQFGSIDPAAAMEAAPAPVSAPAMGPPAPMGMLGDILR